MKKHYPLPVPIELFEHMSKAAIMHVLFQEMLRQHGNVLSATHAIMQEYNHLLSCDFYKGSCISKEKHMQVMFGAIDIADGEEDE